MSMLISSLYFQGSHAMHAMDLAKEEVHELLTGPFAFTTLAVGIIGGAYYGCKGGEALAVRCSKLCGKGCFATVLKTVTVFVCQGVGSVAGAGIGGYAAFAISKNSFEV